MAVSVSAAALSSSLASLTLRTATTTALLLVFPSFKSARISLTSSVPPLQANANDIDTVFFDDLNPEAEVTFDPPEKTEGFVHPRPIDEPPFESEEEAAMAYEELYGPGYSGQSLLGKDVYAMDSKVKKTVGLGGKMKKEKPRDGFEERVVQVRRVTKVVKGGKQLKFRAIVVVGDRKGQVGVGHGKAKEVIGAVQKAATDARRNLITVPMTKYLTFPHRYKGGKCFGQAAGKQ